MFFKKVMKRSKGYSIVTLYEELMVLVIVGLGFVHEGIITFIDYKQRTSTGGIVPTSCNHYYFCLTILLLYF